ncbi:MAG: transcriptional repressor LexA [Acidimicrobiia bacterium]|nr:transcriptional repressor LexA [Acidimicrobiia bacterium]
MQDRPALSTRQQEVLDYIRSMVQSRGYPPSVREIGEALGLSSPSTVHSHLSSLVRFGYLRRDPSKPRAIEVVDDTPATALLTGPTREVPLVGHIAAGSPILAEEDVEDVMALPEQLVGGGPVFMLRVRGDSMVDAGILDGDLVVVRRQPTAENGEIIAALVDGEEATVKHLERRNDAIVLHPANARYEPMVFTDGVEVLGKVVSVLRSI